MSNSIDTTKAQEMYRYKKELKHLHETHQEEIKKIKNNQAIQKVELDAAGAVELENLREENDVALAQEIERRDKVYNEIKNSLTETKEFIDKEKENLKATHEHQLDNHQRNFRNRYSVNKSQNQAVLDKTYQQFNNKIYELSRTGQRELKDLTNSTARLKRKTENINQIKLDNLRDEHRKVYNFKKDQNEKAKTVQEQEFKKVMEHMNDRHLHDMKVHKVSNAKEMEMLKEKHKSALQQENEHFMAKFKHFHSRNKEIFSNLQKRSEDIIAAVKAKFAQNLSVEMDKINDQFYHTRNIAPVVQDLGDKYQIQIKVPEHERKFVQMSGQDRMVKINMSREMDNQYNDKKDIVNRTKKHETHTTEIQLKDLIDGNKVTKTYQNGIMTYTVAKA